VGGEAAPVVVVVVAGGALRCGTRAGARARGLGGVSGSRPASTGADTPRLEMKMEPAALPDTASKNWVGGGRVGGRTQVGGRGQR
jgi:hypothetical protein